MNDPFDQFEETADPFSQFDVTATEAGEAKPAEPDGPAEIFFKNMGKFLSNAGRDALDVGNSIVGPILNPDIMYDAVSGLMYNDEGEFSADGIKAAGSAIADRAGEIVSDPVGSFVDRPISTMMDVATVAMPTRLASAATRPVSGAVSRGLNNAAEVIDNFDPLNLATTGAAGMAARVDGQTRMEEVLKPSLSPSDRRMKPEHRQRVINSALDRKIMPTADGMGRLQALIHKEARQADKIIMDSDVIISVDDIVTAVRSQADNIKDSNKNAIKLRESINAQADDLARRYEGREVLGAEELRDLRRSADDVINQNRIYLNGEPVQVQTDKAYADSLRAALGDAVPELKAHNAEMSTLYDIADMYEKPTQRLRNNNSSSLPQQIAMGNMGASIGGGSIASHLLGFDPTLGAAAGALASGVSYMRNDPARRMRAAQTSHDVNNGGLLLRDADKYSPGSDARYSLLLMDELMKDSDEDYR